MYLWQCTKQDNDDCKKSCYITVKVHKVITAILGQLECRVSRDSKFRVIVGLGSGSGLGLGLVIMFNF